MALGVCLSLICIFFSFEGLKLLVMDYRENDDKAFNSLQFAENENNSAKREFAKQILFGACALLGLLATLDSTSETTTTKWIYTLFALCALSSAAALGCASLIAEIRYRFAAKVAAKTLTQKGLGRLQRRVEFWLSFYRVLTIIGFASFVGGVVLLAARQILPLGCLCRCC